MTTRTIARIVAKYSRQLTGGTINPHTLRHSSPRISWMKGPISAPFKKCWGMSRSATTQKYTHLATDQLLAAYDRAHPRAEPAGNPCGGSKGHHDDCSIHHALRAARRQVAMGCDGQVTVGTTVMKHNARKLRRMHRDQVLAGFAGATADAFTLFEKFEG